MSRNGKIVLGIVAGGLVLCVVAAVAGVLMLSFTTGSVLARNVSTETTEVAAAANKIVDYTLPAGFREEFSLDLAGVTFVSIRPQGDHDHIFLFQAPGFANMDRERMEREFRQTAQRQSVYGNDRVQMRTVGSTKVTIRGQEVTMRISEGTNSSEKPYREMLGFFEGKNGPALLVVSGQTSEWNQEAIDAFIASMR